MSAALIKKAFRDYRLLVAAAATVLLGFVIVFMFAISSMPLTTVQFWNDIPWIRKLMSAMMGADIGEMFTQNGITSFVYTHPLMWIMVIGSLLTMTSGVLAGEVDRGTMDLLATLPISRTRIYASLTMVAVLFGLPVCWTIWLGVCVGRALVGWGEVRLDVLAILTCHLYAVYVFLACFSMAVSALCSRRTTALLICFVVVFYSFVINLLMAFWPALERIAFTGFLNYYSPLPIVRDHAWHWDDIGVLLAAGLVCWTVGLLGFQRRDVPAR